MKVLLVEDDNLTRRVLSKQIARLGHIVMESSSARDGLDYWRSGDYPVVVCDWLMPGMDGLDLCAHIRKEPAPFYTYFILLTANADRIQCDEAIQRGVDDFLPKPFSELELFNRLRVAERIIGFVGEMIQIKRILTTCMYTGQVKDDNGKWMDFKEFVTKRLGTRISHGLSPEGYEKFMETEQEHLVSKKDPEKA